MLRLKLNFMRENKFLWEAKFRKFIKFGASQSAFSASEGMVNRIA